MKTTTNSLSQQIMVVPIALAFLLAGISSGGENFAGWGGFYVLTLFAAGLLWLGWHVIQAEDPPRWLFWLAVGAAVLRLGLGVFWQTALPVWGYDEEVQRAGYLMKDAYQRDGIAWKMAQSDTPLYQAFTGYSETDQYGGLLFLSAGVYRYLGGESHLPLMITVLTAAFSSLGVYFTWGLARRLWGADPARGSAWGMALYPEAVMLGSVQMREPFLIPIMVAALYFLHRRWENGSRWDAVWVAGLVIFGAAFSWPFAGMLGLALIVFGLALGREQIFVGKRGWLVGLGLAVLALMIGFALDQNLHWVREIIKWQTYSSVKISGRLALLFEQIPEAAQLPFLVGYGAVRPLLPSALFDETILLWWMVAVWRALGWTVLLLLLLYATFLVVKDRMWKQSVAVFLLINWLVVIVAAYRGGGDLWDNPRYRATFAGIQIALAAWAWGRQKATQDPWLRRGFGMTLMMLAWFGPWYIQRKFFDLHWQVWELGDLVGLGLATGLLYLLWDWMRENGNIEMD